jgi:protein-S-isoprenylcysteine O-methyltransferase Ste14
MLRLSLQILAWTAVLGVVLFWPAGTFHYPGGWVYLGVFAVVGSAISFWLYKHNPRLLRERMSSPVQREQKPWDRVFLSLFLLGFFAWMAFMAWDAARTQFVAIPPWLQAVGALGIVLGFAGGWLTFRENTFAAPVVKIQSDHKVIDTGAYAFVRHPMYAGAVLYLIGMPLLLSSRVGLALSPIFILALAWRTVQEERTLRAELPGYEAYTGRVRYRLIPYVW